MAQQTINQPPIRSKMFDAIPDSNKLSRVWLAWLSSLAGITQATSTMIAGATSARMYLQNSTPIVNNSETTMPVNIVSFDPSTICNTSTHSMTPSVSNNYVISTKLRFSYAAVSFSVTINFKVNNITQSSKTITVPYSGLTGTFDVDLVDVVAITAGQTLTCTVTQNSPAAQTLVGGQQNTYLTLESAQ